LGLDFLSRYDPDALRYYLTTIMPEAHDSDWDWNEFYHHNNDELVATWGNLANRVLAFANNIWEGVVPNPGQFEKEDLDLLAQIEAGFDTVGKELDAVHLRSALSEAMRLASEVNKYLDQTSPWFTVKTDKQKAGRAIFVAMKAIDSLKIMFAPFLPFSSEKLNTYLGYDEQIFGEQYTQEFKDNLGTHKALLYNPEKAHGRWQPSNLQPGSRFNPPSPLFKKLDEKIVEEERQRLG
jgi:methionyl-tRNA synthetase